LTSPACGVFFVRQVIRDLSSWLMRKRPFTYFQATEAAPCLRWWPYLHRDGLRARLSPAADNTSRKAMVSSNIGSIDKAS
jgi:hypothetical protein